MCVPCAGALHCASRHLSLCGSYSTTLDLSPPTVRYTPYYSSSLLSFSSLLFEIFSLLNAVYSLLRYCYTIQCDCSCNHVDSKLLLIIPPFRSMISSSFSSSSPLASLFITAKQESALYRTQDADVTPTQALFYIRANARTDTSTHTLFVNHSLLLPPVTAEVSEDTACAVLTASPHHIPSSLTCPLFFLVCPHPHPHPCLLLLLLPPVPLSSALC